MASAETSNAREHPLPYARGRCLPCPGRARGTGIRATSLQPRTSPARLTVSRVSPPARSSGAGSQRLSSALSRPPAAPWSGCVFSAHHHVHQLVARVQQPRRPEGAASAAAAAAAAAGGGDGQRAAVGGEQPPLETPGPRGTAAAGRIPRREGPQGDSSLAGAHATQPGDPAHLSLPPFPGLGGAVSRCHSEDARGADPLGWGGIVPSRCEFLFGGGGKVFPGIGVRRVDPKSNFLTGTGLEVEPSGPQNCNRGWVPGA